MAEKITIGVLKREAESKYLFATNTRLAYKKERDYLLDRLGKTKGIKTYKTDSAFILIEIGEETGYTSASLKDTLVRDYSILIRDASNFDGLGASFVRVAIKDRKSNEILIGALFSVFGGENL